MDVQIRDQVRVDVPKFFEPAIGDAGEVPALQLFVGGQWGPAKRGEVFDVASPIDGSVIARAAKASADDVNQAIAAARVSRAGFRHLPAAERLDICERAAGFRWEDSVRHLDRILRDAATPTP